MRVIKLILFFVLLMFTNTAECAVILNISADGRFDGDPWGDIDYFVQAESRVEAHDGLVFFRSNSVSWNDTITISVETTQGEDLTGLSLFVQANVGTQVNTDADNDFGSFAEARAEVEFQGDEAIAYATTHDFSDLVEAHDTMGAEVPVTEGVMYTASVSVWAYTQAIEYRDCQYEIDYGAAWAEANVGIDIGLYDEDGMPYMTEYYHCSSGVNIQDSTTTENAVPLPPSWLFLATGAPLLGVLRRKFKGAKN